MASRPPSQLTFRDVTSHLGVIVALSALMGLLVAGLAIPFAGALGMGAKSLSETVKVRLQPLSLNCSTCEYSLSEMFRWGCYICRSNPSRIRQKSTVADSCKVRG